MYVLMRMFRKKQTPKSSSASWLTAGIVAAVTVIVGAGLACTDRNAATAEKTIPAEAGAVSTLPPETLEALAARAPELLPDAQPEPLPREDADPRNIPQRLADALSADILETVTGSASFYADTFEGRRTASGIPFRQNQLVAAHRAYPFGTILRVTNLNNDRSVNVRVVDRGPFGNSSKAKRRIIDLSRRAANELGFVRSGHTEVRVEVLQWGKGIAG